MDPSALEHPLRRRLAGNPDSAIYGTIVAAGVVAVEGGTTHSVASILVAMVGTLVVFWLAHAYAHLLATGMIEHESDWRRIRLTLRAEWPVVESGILPALALVVLGGSRHIAILGALIVAVAELCGWAALACRRREVGLVRSAVYIAVAALLGVAVIGLKAAVH